MLLKASAGLKEWSQIVFEGMDYMSSSNSLPGVATVNAPAATRASHKRIHNHTTSLTGLRIAFIGDSITLFQYLSLLYYAHFGKWESPLAKNSLMDRTLWITSLDWSRFYQHCQQVFGSKYLQVDAYRYPIDLSNPTFCPKTYTENWYYYQPETDNLMCKSLDSMIAMVIGDPATFVLGSRQPSTLHEILPQYGRMDGEIPSRNT